MGLEAKSTENNSKIKKQDSSSNRTFIIGIAFWWTIFALIPVFIFAVQGDWIIVFSIASKVGIVFICLGFILLSAKGTFKVVSRGGVTAPVDYGSEDEGEVAILERKQNINYWEIFLMGRIWLLLWGFLHLIPLAFGVPFMI